MKGLIGFYHDHNFFCAGKKHKSILGDLGEVSPPRYLTILLDKSRLFVETKSVLFHKDAPESLGNAKKSLIESFESGVLTSESCQRYGYK